MVFKLKSIFQPLIDLTKIQSDLAHSKLLKRKAILSKRPETTQTNAKYRREFSIFEKFKKFLKDIVDSDLKGCRMRVSGE
jgi:hypothetical protein